MTRCPFPRGFIAVLSLLALFTSLARAQERPIVRALGLTHTDQEVLLHLSLDGGFHPELMEAIESGIPITISYHMKLYRVRALWFDEEVLSKTIKRIVKYDALKKQYRVSEINGLFSSIRVSKDEPTMVRWMSEIEGQPLIPFPSLTTARRILCEGHGRPEGGNVALSTQSYSVSCQPLGYGNSLDRVEPFRDQYPPATTLSNPWLMSRHPLLHRRGRRKTFHIRVARNRPSACEALRTAS